MWETLHRCIILALHEPTPVPPSTLVYLRSLLRHLGCRDDTPFVVVQLPSHDTPCVWPAPWATVEERKSGLLHSGCMPVLNCSHLYLNVEEAENPFRQMFVMYSGVRSSGRPGVVQQWEHKASSLNTKPAVRKSGVLMLVVPPACFALGQCLRLCVSVFHLDNGDNDIYLRSEL